MLPRKKLLLKGFFNKVNEVELARVDGVVWDVAPVSRLRFVPGFLESFWLDAKVLK